jgi:RimJ/RimL family protein N-acetyltransferase
MDASSSSAWQDIPTLRGRHVVIEPMARDHVDGLAAAAADGRLWELPFTNVPAPGETAAYVQSALDMQADGSAQAFVVRNASGAIVGTTRYYDLAPAVPRLQVGYTWYARSVQRTGLNTEAKLLLLTYAFETLGCVSVGLQTSHLNQASRKAIARIGATQEGILRQHMRHRDGSLRDTVCFSIIDSEWPAAKARLQVMLAEHDA